jgi:hypothetical protein
MREKPAGVPVACPSERTRTVAYGHLRGERQEGAGHRYRRWLAVDDADFPSWQLTNMSLLRSKAEFGSGARRLSQVSRPRQDGLVTMDESGLMALLRRLDDPEWLEWPSDYSNSKAAAFMRRLASDLESAFGTHCPAEGDSQDSSEYGRVEIPAEMTVCGTRIIVCLSKFHPLALVTADNPGAYLGLDEAQSLGDLDGRDLATVQRAVQDAGYVAVAEEFLNRRYDGPSRLPRFGREPHWQPSWWDRFFGYF